MVEGMHLDISLRQVMTQLVVSVNREVERRREAAARRARDVETRLGFARAAHRGY